MADSVGGLEKLNGGGGIGFRAAVDFDDDKLAGGVGCEVAESDGRVVRRVANSSYDGRAGAQEVGRYEALTEA